MQHIAYIAIGSNLDDPISHIQTALVELTEIPESKVLDYSRVYQSSPHGPIKQNDFLNGVIKLATTLTPIQLLDALQQLEQHHQRRRLQHWGPRTLDLDILLYDQQIIATSRLTIPHPGLKERDFVLYPLTDLNPELVLPDGTALSLLLESVAGSNIFALDMQIYSV